MAYPIPIHLADCVVVSHLSLIPKTNKGIGKRQINPKIKHIN